MPNTMICQITQAIRFHDENFAEVLRVRDVVVDAGQRYVAKPSVMSRLPATVMERIQAAIREKRPEFIGQELRRLAVELTADQDIDQRMVYWAMIDASNHWSDATGSRWAYMSMNGRLQHLAWAV